MIQVVLDRWHHEKGLSGIMVYFENCLVDSYSRGNGSGLARVVPREEAGYLAIVSFRGPADKRIFHPNPTKVCNREFDNSYVYSILSPHTHNGILIFMCLSFPTEMYNVEV